MMNITKLLQLVKDPNIMKKHNLFKLVPLAENPKTKEPEAKVNTLPKRRLVKNTKVNKPTNSPDTPTNGSTPNGPPTPPLGPNGRNPCWTSSLN
jgi:hypothetical protein